ncbi:MULTISPECIES: DUF3073 domain-containing protein [Streptomycetaceae]|nr:MULTISPECIES: DUF3073 domain-containing protein [unclassified Streptomyces]MDX2850067.1 DUF3073 domain-containing protein [Streptomyces sp. PA03-3a]
MKSYGPGLSPEGPFHIVNACQDSGPSSPTVEGVEPMGRGRAKAKQTKVARQLKYNSGGTDLSRLAEELGASSTLPVNPEVQEDDDDDELEDDPYARYADLYGDDEDDDEDDESQSSSQRRRA